MPSPNLLNTAQVAEHLGIHVETARRYLREGRIKSIRLGNGPRAERRVTEKALDEWARRNQA